MVDRDFTWLYVPHDEQEEALALGAVRVVGDSRLVEPRPYPVGIPRNAFARWKTTRSRYRWCVDVVEGVLDDLVGGERQHLDELLEAVAEGSDSRDRVYLFATGRDFARLRQIPGVFWDRRLRMYYATAAAPFAKLFRYLTPSARAAFEAERLGRRTTDYLVREQAAAEVDRRGGGDDHAAVLKPKPGGSGGGPEQAPAAPAKPENAAAVDERAAPEAEGGEREGGAILE